LISNSTSSQVSENLRIDFISSPATLNDSIITILDNPNFRYSTNEGTSVKAEIEMDVDNSPGTVIAVGSYTKLNGSILSDTISISYN